MSRQEYIDLLNERINILNSADFDSKVWTDQTIETLRRLFPISHESKEKSIRRLNYHLGNIGTDQKAREEYLEKNKRRAKEYILGFIREIEHGIEKNQQQPSHFTMIKNISFWTILLIVVGGSFSLGYYFGNNKFDSEKNNLFMETLKLKTMIDRQNQSIDSLRNVKLSGGMKRETDGESNPKK